MFFFLTFANSTFHVDVADIGTHDANKFKFYVFYFWRNLKYVHQSFKFNPFYPSIYLEILPMEINHKKIINNIIVVYV